jgi:hypothetical protein
MKLQLIALLGAAAVITAACGSQSTTTATETQTVTRTATSAPTPGGATGTSTTQEAQPDLTACTELKGTTNGDGTCTVHEVTDDYTIDMVFPAAFPDQDGIVNVLNGQRAGFLDLIKDRPNPPNPYALDITDKTFTSGDDETGTVSVVFEEYVNVGGAHPTTNYDALSYDLAKKAPITLDTLFKPGSDPTSVLDPIVKANLEQLIGSPVDDNPIGLDMYKNFALTDDDVHVFLGQGVWVFEAAGAREITIPRSQLASILA